MFKKLREVFSRFIETASSLLSSREKLLESIEELKLSLVANDVAYEVAENIASELTRRVEEGSIKSREDLVKALREILLSYFTGLNSIDLLSLASSRKPLKIVFLGVNGVGKTTTIAKVAVYMRENGFKPLMVAADTFRAGAQEQLKIHSERTGIPVFTGKYGSDPAALVYDAIQYGLNRGFNVFLIDTAGRMHVDVDLVNELKKIVRVAKPDVKILVVDALTGNDALEQARFFNEAVGVDCVVVTKVDAYEEGGVPLSLVYILKKPVLFIGVGQDYKDLKPFNPIEYVERILTGLQ
ncbi:signal recognition particle-docking protein FtsY [Desulfurococcus amylolyticus]|uniref:Signal recognition particle receptor FtsY n=1 Tax=Desulfurococcus amylolyticus DSM 16532 TaxID=768672 RepID=I3XT18_DESAM|nr:signal recognition particle-docking protein FtsY [Desulfurococcus amylolyticus]AFL67092.1 signal recognition particle-docking protein FtsY [Desulfurococcus amylolyticus DSM 16532]